MDMWLDFVILDVEIKHFDSEIEKKKPENNVNITNEKTEENTSAKDKMDEIQE
eukprot:CAMPEP_0201571494 /NCGR_PEP_ID=MMETSP0190_2-20130828/14306_1 /ASSEMBLY_ACC=CAM_ASM_000263 /TAXON_ID=37353 /ORGANISM="Rosalina sp." /LENGTH=52 /DNA_ID=CAMNT_0047996213 /DNA_START=34 /DNA_END=189 /DNA_ORIENTATION=+